MRVLATIAQILLVALFALMAAIQLNDPDPLYWIVVYLCVAAMPVTRLINRNLPTLLAVTIGLVLAGLLYSVTGFFDYLQSGDYSSLSGAMMAEKPYVEPAREFLGLLFALLMLVYYRWRPISGHG